jgi:hypothetical protein
MDMNERLHDLNDKDETKKTGKKAEDKGSIAVDKEKETKKEVKLNDPMEKKKE